MASQQPEVLNDAPPPHLGGGSMVCSEGGLGPGGMDERHKRYDSCCAGPVHPPPRVLSDEEGGRVSEAHPGMLTLCQ